MSNTRKSVSSDIQTLQSWLKETWLHLVFSNPFQSVWISDEMLVFDILLQWCFHQSISSQQYFVNNIEGEQETIITK